jgi:hypothetical protein
MQYFPTTFPKDKGPPRQYFFDVLNTVYPDYLRQIMSHANSERMAADTDQNKTSSIRISQFWEEELKAMPYLSRKCKIRYLKNHRLLITRIYIQSAQAKQYICSSPAQRKSPQTGRGKSTSLWGLSVNIRSQKRNRNRSRSSSRQQNLQPQFRKRLGSRSPQPPHWRHHSSYRCLLSRSSSTIPKKTQK